MHGRVLMIKVGRTFVRQMETDGYVGLSLKQYEVSKTDQYVSKRPYSDLDDVHHYLRPVWILESSATDVVTGGCGVDVETWGRCNGSGEKY